MTVGRTPPPTRATLAGHAYLDLRAMAKKAGRANDEYLRLYALEGFLVRLAASASSQDFVLKGGVLLAAYQLRRPTADIDFAALETSNDVGTINPWSSRSRTRSFPMMRMMGSDSTPPTPTPSQSARRTHKAACASPSGLNWRPQRCASTSTSILETRFGPAPRRCSFPAC